MRIYVASSWRNTYQPLVVRYLREVGHEVYDFRNPPGGSGFAWSDISPDWENWTNEQYRHIVLNNPIASHGFISDKRAMEWADACVLVLPCGRSAHLEAGWFCGQGKRCVIYIPSGEKVEPELMNLLATDICLDINEVFSALG